MKRKIGDSITEITDNPLYDSSGLSKHIRPVGALLGLIIGFLILGALVLYSVNSGDLLQVPVLIVLSAAAGTAFSFPLWYYNVRGHDKTSSNLMDSINSITGLLSTQNASLTNNLKEIVTTSVLGGKVGVNSSPVIAPPVTDLTPVITSGVTPVIQSKKVAGPNTINVAGYLIDVPRWSGVPRSVTEWEPMKVQLRNAIDADLADRKARGLIIGNGDEFSSNNPTIVWNWTQRLFGVRELAGEGGYECVSNEDCLDCIDHPLTDAARNALLGVWGNKPIVCGCSSCKDSSHPVIYDGTSPDTLEKAEALRHIIGKFSEASGVGYGQAIHALNPLWWCLKHSDAIKAIGDTFDLSTYPVWGAAEIASGIVTGSVSLYSCQYCTTGFGMDYDAYVNHVIEKHSENLAGEYVGDGRIRYECRFCGWGVPGKDFPTLPDAIGHILLTHPGKGIKTKEEFRHKKWQEIIGK